MKKIYQNAAFLSGAHVAGYFIPLFEIPILARSLGPEAYGTVVFFQSLALMGSMFVEYGFNLSASRQVALALNERGLLGRIFADVLLAKIILSFVFFIAFISLIFARGVAGSTGGNGFFIWASVYFFAFGFSPFWYFQGSERMAGVVSLEFGLRLIGLSLLFIFVNGAQDAEIALAILAIVGLTNTVLATMFCIREIDIPRFSLGGAINQIRQGLHVFVYRSSNNILLSAAPSVLGYVVGPVALAAFVPAEKVIRAVVGLANPILSALFPYFSRSLNNPNQQLLSRAWIIIFSVALAGTTCAVSLFFAGPLLLNVVLGPEYLLAEKLLGWFVWLIPLRMMNAALGMVLLIPARMDRVASSLFMTFAILALVLGAGLAVYFGALGMVIGFLIAETLLMISLMGFSINLSSKFFS